jgi:hypothetical protein
MSDGRAAVAQFPIRIADIIFAERGANGVQTEVPRSNDETHPPLRRPFRIKIRQGMIAVAGAAVAFAAFGVNWTVTMVIVAFVVSALITKPDAWQGWAPFW